MLDDRDFNGLAAFADPVRAHGVIDRFTRNAYDLVIEASPHVVMPQPWTFSNMALTARDRAVVGVPGDRVTIAHAASALHLSLQTTEKDL